MTISNNYPTVHPSLLLDFANSKALDPRISFIRSTTATYYDGVTQALAEQNLLLQSNSFSTSPWAATTATLAGSVSDPFGGTTAFSMTATAGNATLYQSYTATGLVQSFSIYIQRVTGTGTINITANGATGLTAQTISGTWTRYTVTATPSAGAVSIGIQLVTSGDAVNIYGAVLEERATPIPYQPNYQTTTTAPISNYIPKLLTAAINQPRFDFDPVTGLSKGLLIERGFTNVITYSQDFTQSIYTKTNITAANAQNIAPDGTLNANTLTETTATGYHQFSLTQITYSQSFFFKPNGRNFVSFSSTSNPTANNYQIFNLSTGALGAGAGFRTDVPPQIYAVGNGWYRCFVVNQTATLYVSFSNDGTTWSYTGDGYSGVYVWGAQSDQQGSLHSYIPTNGVTVTSGSDTVTMTGTNFSSWFNNGQGTFYAEQYNQGGFFDSFANILFVDDGVNSFTNTLQLKKGAPSSPYIVAAITNSTTSVYSQTLLTTGAFVPSYSQSDPASTIVKVALSYSNTSTSGKANSATALTTTPTAIPPTMSRLSIGNAAGNNLFGNGYAPLYGWMKKLAYYPVQTTVAQITGLTSS